MLACHLYQNAWCIALWPAFEATNLRLAPAPDGRAYPLSASAQMHVKRVV